MIKKLKELEQAATPRPWRGDRYDGTVKYAIQGADEALVCLGCNGNSAGDHPYGFQSEEDERFVMETRNILPALIAVVEAAEEVQASRDATLEWGAEQELNCGDWVEPLLALTAREDKAKNALRYALAKLKEQAS